MAFLTALETKTGEAVDPTTLNGKVVALYFSSSWCPACVTFTPLLSVLHEEALEEGIDFEVIYVSSDSSSHQCSQYMQEKHGDWLRVNWDQRQSVKQKYGVFAGKEQSDFPDTKRRSGIPTLIIIGKDGEEKEILDCDNRAVLKEMESKGTDYLNRWTSHKW